MIHTIISNNIVIYILRSFPVDSYVKEQNSARALDTIHFLTHLPQLMVDRFHHQLTASSIYKA